MVGSFERVENAAALGGLTIAVVRFGKSTRTAEEAAEQCGCGVDQIVKSLIFQGKTSGKLILFLVPGSRRLNEKAAKMVVGETVNRADPETIRQRTGFAIGGVSPLGSLEPLAVYAAKELLEHDIVWAAAGAHDAVFSVEPESLISATSAVVCDIAG